MLLVCVTGLGLLRAERLLRTVIRGNMVNVHYSGVCVQLVQTAETLPCKPYVDNRINNSLSTYVCATKFDFQATW